MNCMIKNILNNSVDLDKNYHQVTDPRRSSKYADLMFDFDSKRADFKSKYVLRFTF